MGSICRLLLVYIVFIAFILSIDDMSVIQFLSPILDDMLEEKNISSMLIITSQMFTSWILHWIHPKCSHPDPICVEKNVRTLDILRAPPPIHTYIHSYIHTYILLGLASTEASKAHGQMLVYHINQHMMDKFHKLESLLGWY